MMFGPELQQEKAAHEWGGKARGPRGAAWRFLQADLADASGRQHGKSHAMLIYNLRPHVGEELAHGARDDALRVSDVGDRRRFGEA